MMEILRRELCAQTDFCAGISMFRIKLDCLEEAVRYTLIVLIKLLPLFSLAGLKMQGNCPLLRLSVKFVVDK